MYKIPRQSYTVDFKREAVRLVQRGARLAAVTKQLGISEQTLANWRKAEAAGKLAASCQKMALEEMEFTRLRAENQRLKMVSCPRVRGNLPSRF